MPSLVSVIIPTLHRPALVQNAIRSVLAQTRASLELIVIVDGPDPQTQSVLAGIADPRLQILSNPSSIGPGPARNLAALQARGEWLAFLDDDDIWLPEKLARQLDGHDPEEDLVLSCRATMQLAGRIEVWPRRLPQPRERIDEYLFARKTLLQGSGYVATSALVMPARLFARTGFGASRQQEDTTLLIRAVQLQGARLIMLPEALVRVRADDPSDSLGSGYPWRSGLDWLDSTGDAMSDRATAGYCLVTLGAQAARQRDLASVPALLTRAFRRGTPNPLHLLLFCLFWLTPQWFRGATGRFGARLRPGRMTGTGTC